jgi:putative PIN family toxin of toxin-antitoxin system
LRRNTQPGLASGDLVRAVVDANVLISAVLSAKGPSAEIISEMLLTELTRTLAYPRLRKRIPQEKADAYINWIRDHGRLGDDPTVAPPVGSRDPDDDYLLALAIEQRGYLVTGDQDLLVLNADLPILTPAQFVAKLREPTRAS